MIGRGLRSLVDWNCVYAGNIDCQLSRGLRSLVDWNVKKPIVNLSVKVEAYVASWIEMSYVFGRWDRRIVEAYVASWIEIQTKLAGQLMKESRLT